ncbi:MAG: hypothetical protein RML36_03475 [Anaerolineae bacterium]|nr:hypothetical protein [Anaerolineae bacterium]MDW8098529.1 hypothetical protein [Anaerolineae bacterium]
MAFEVQDFHDLVKLLTTHPEWRTELRTLLLSEELLTLPQLVRGLIEAQRRAEERLTRLEETVAALAEAQRRAEERLTRLEETVAALAEAQRRAEERLTRLEEAQQRTEERLTRLEEAQQRTEERLARLEEIQLRHEERLANVEERLQRLEEIVATLITQVQALTEQMQSLTRQVAALVESQKRIEDIVGDLKGRVLESTYRDHVGGYFGQWLRRVRAVVPEALEEALEQRLSDEEVLDVFRLDLLVNGRLRTVPEAPEVWLAVEVSAVLDEGDVERARRRATLLQRAGYHALPVVAGERITQGAEASARDHRVSILLDGQAVMWHGIGVN